MKEKKSKFIRILGAEIEDLTEDLAQLISAYRARRDKGEITNYVFKENCALLASEIACLKSFGQIVSTMDTERFQTLEELCTHIGSEFLVKRRQCVSTPAIDGVFERKLRKVLAYVMT